MEPWVRLLLVWSGQPPLTSLPGRLSATWLPPHWPPQISSPRGLSETPKTHVAWVLRRWAAPRKSASPARWPGHLPARGGQQAAGAVRGEGQLQAAALGGAGPKRKREDLGPWTP